MNQLDDLKEIEEVFQYFYESYYRLTGRNHPRLSNQTIENIVEQFYGIDDEGFVYDLESYELMIDKYFATTFENCNYSIAHFMSGAIRKFRFYEECY